jgi:cytochrome c-type biogenesis protein CcmH
MVKLNVAKRLCRPPRPLAGEGRGEGNDRGECDYRAPGMAHVAMIVRHIVWVLLAALLWSGCATAKEAPLASKDPALEQRMKNLSDKLRCLVCQNQTLADSNAALAVDLRNEIREKMQKGMTDAEIRTYLVDRYGDFVLFQPPFKPTTFLLWLGPFLLLALGFGILYLNLRRRQKLLAEPEQNSADLAMSRSLLNETQDKP